ncbi:MAG: hypothetical protein AAF730_12170 [Bacteroidota bacterium]
MRALGLSVCCTLLLLSLAGRGVQAQTQLGPIQVSGGIGFEGQAYASDGIAGRRAPASMRTYANANVSLYGLTTGLNLSFDTDQSRLRRNVNRLQLDTRWAQGRVAAGDVSPRLSRYSLSGTIVRGGLVEYNPGTLHLTVTGGQPRRSTTLANTLTDQQDERWLVGTRFGWGKPRETHFHLIGVYVRDVLPSTLEPGTVNPAENFSLTPSVSTKLLDGKLTMTGQVTMSAFTLDTRAPQASGSQIPGWLRWGITPRAGSQVDYAGEASAALNLGWFGVQSSYSRIQPGFESLGLQYTRADQEVVRLQPRLSLLNSRVNLGFTLARTRNNLLDQRQSTLERDQGGVTAQVRLLPSLSLSSSYMRMGNTNTPRSGVADRASLQQSQLSQAVMLAPVFTVQRPDGLSHTVALSLAFQQTDDNSLAVQQNLRPAVGNESTTAMLNYALGFTSGLSVNLRGNALQSEAGGATTDVRGVQVGLGQTFIDRALNVRASAGWTQTESARSFVLPEVGTQRSRIQTAQWLTTLSANYRLPGGDAIRFTLRGVVNDAQTTGGRDFSEVQAALRYDHRF